MHSSLTMSSMYGLEEFTAERSRLNGPERLRIQIVSYGLKTKIMFSSPPPDKDRSSIPNDLISEKGRGRIEDDHINVLPMKEALDACTYMGGVSVGMSFLTDFFLIYIQGDVNVAEKVGCPCDSGAEEICEKDLSVLAEKDCKKLFCIIHR